MACLGADVQDDKGSGMLILAEEYDLAQELISSSIALSPVALLPVIPLWLVLFGYAWLSLG